MDRPYRQFISRKGDSTPLTYAFDKVSNLKGLADEVYTNSGSSAISLAEYDDLHRLTNLVTAAQGTLTYTYGSTGNLTKNSEMGAGTYTYSATKPHAVTSANGKTYSYDACGNMTNRNGQTLVYDAENRLVSVSGGGGPTVTFGYADAGARLWRNSSQSGLTVWIGGIYEERGGKVLCHVMAGGRRVATFEPQGGLFGYLQQEHPEVAGVMAFLGRAFSWPLERRRAPVTITVTSLLLALGLMIWARRRQPEAAAPRLWIARGWRLAGLQFVSVWTIVALILGSTNLNVHAQVYNPVFYYYLPDHLGSSQILVDRSGERVQHYENTAYGKQRFQDNASAFGMSHRFTGQIFDDETGLYYFGARYYDPELGRFTQPDTVVPQPDNPQTLNRYAYCIGNPLKYTDATGHFIELAFAIIAVTAIGAATGACTAAAFGGDPAKGAVGGAIGAAFGFVVGPVGGVVGAAVAAAVNGDDLGYAVLGASISAGIGYAVGQLTNEAVKSGISRTVALPVANLATGSLGGGISAMIQGGDFATGAAQGAAGAAIFTALHYAYLEALVTATTTVQPGFSKEQKINVSKGLRQFGSTRVGQLTLWKAATHFKRLSVEPIERQEPAGGNFRIAIHKSAVGGISPDVRETYDQLFKLGELPSPRHRYYWGLLLGHEAGHAVGYEDDTTTWAERSQNVIWQVERPLRREFGLRERTYWHEEPIFSDRIR